MRRLLLVTAAVAVPGTALAQDGVALLGPQFFVAILAGVVLAIGFQLLLTNLSVAAGVSAVGSFDADADSRKDLKDRDASYLSEAHKKVRKATSGLGLWTLVTASVALFFASWLGVELATTYTLLVGAVLGLVIWALFYTAMTALELSAAMSLVGFMTRTATAGLSSVYGGLSSVFARAPETRVADTAAEVVRSVKDELSRDRDVITLRRELSRFLEQAQQPAIDPVRLREELTKLFQDVQLEAVAVEDPSVLADESVVVARLEKRGMTKADAKRFATNVKDAVTNVSRELREKRGVTGVMDAAMQATGLSREEAAAQRERIERYLRETGRPELEPEQIKRDIEALFTDPAHAKETLLHRLQLFDRQTALALLTQRGFEPDKADRFVSVAESVIGRLRSMYAGQKQPSFAQGQPGETYAAGTTLTGPQGATLKQKAKERFERWLDSLQDPALRSEDVERDLELLFSDPKAGFDALRHRLQALDRETLKSVIASSRRDWSEEDVERMLVRVEGARDRALDQAERMRVEVDRRMHEAREAALKQAEEVRKDAAVAAWWAAGSAVVSGAAAVGGGMLAAVTPF